GMIDVAAFIRHVAAEVFVADNDGFIGDYGTNNLYVYRSDLLPLEPIAWDKSEAFFAGAGYSIFHNLNDVPVDFRNRLFTRLLSFPDWRALYLNTLLTYAQSASEVPVTALPGDTRGWLALEV